MGRSSGRPFFFDKIMERLDWTQYYMGMVHWTAMRSPDQSTKVGAVLVGPDRTILSCGYNGPVRGLDENSDLSSLDKYDVTEHAERNAIYNAGRMGVKLIGSTLYTTAIPCINCARGVIQAGIKSVVFDVKCAQIFEEADKEGKYGFDKSKKLLYEAGILTLGVEFTGSEIIRLIRGQQM